MAGAAPVVVAPPTNVRASDVPNDHGHALVVHWTLSADDGQGQNNILAYKVLRTLDDDLSWNFLILREYKSLASMEADAEKSDALSQQSSGNDDVQMKGYENRSNFREVLATKTARELMLK